MILCAVLVLAFAVANFLAEVRCGVARERSKSPPTEDREDDVPF
jgi:hypothetical protein